MIAVPAVQAMLWETSLLDPEEGIRFRGHSIPEVQARGSRAQAELGSAVGARCDALLPCQAWPAGRLAS